MNAVEIEQKAKVLEREAENGQTDAMAQELHNMSKEDRLAVVNKINSDVQQHPSDALPKLEFYDSTGDLKAVHKKDNLATTDTEYDQTTGNKKSTHIVNWDGPTEDDVFDLTTGKQISRLRTNTDKSSVEDDFDPKTGYFKSEHIKNKDGSSQDVFEVPNAEQLASIKHDPSGKIIETSGTDYRDRKFHYDNDGKLDQIDGHLGHWDRTEKDGKITWRNKDSGAVWEGSFSLDKEGNLHFKANKGQSWMFTRDGQDVRE